MGDFHRPTGGTDRSSSSTIEAPAARRQEKITTPAPAPRITDAQKATGDRAKTVVAQPAAAKPAATPAKAPPPAAKPAPVTSSPHVPVTPTTHAGGSKIATSQAPASKPPAEVPKAIEVKPAQVPVVPAAKTESTPASPAAPKAPEIVVAASPVVEEVVDKTRQGLLTLLSSIAAEEPNYPRDGDKAARATWLSESLVKLARVVLNKRPKVEALTGDANARNDLMGDIAAKLKKDLKDKFPNTPMPNFLRR